MVSDLTGKCEHNSRWWAAAGELTRRFQAALVVVPCRRYCDGSCPKTVGSREKWSSMCVGKSQRVSLEEGGK